VQRVPANQEPWEGRGVPLSCLVASVPHGDGDSSREAAEDRAAKPTFCVGCRKCAIVLHR
jgi:hypothetical protein